MTEESSSVGQSKEGKAPRENLRPHRWLNFSDLARLISDAGRDANINSGSRKVQGSSVELAFKALQPGKIEGVDYGSYYRNLLSIAKKKHVSPGFAYELALHIIAKRKRPLKMEAKAEWAKALSWALKRRG